VLALAALLRHFHYPEFGLPGLDADLCGQYPARDFVVSVQQLGIFENRSGKDWLKEGCNGAKTTTRLAKEGKPRSG